MELLVTKTSVYVLVQVNVIKVFCEYDKQVFWVVTVLCLVPGGKKI